MHTSTLKIRNFQGTIVDRKIVLKQAGVVHNSKSIKTVASLLCIQFFGMESTVGTQQF